ncbi:DotG/IcmE/VirB10 family protein (plasmid) [Stutzerimonas frequens]|uniref:DotG/IcmE/VirB10 family protein n=1 Tax=Stutzerimonas frequens TaxID=2968969 RepID=UPI002DBD1750|nr:DotG/IcmE/VirB10 family protein [Stutzerimonas frequens]WRW29278.1 DotG/IcmE/VirB10 family protein [Stutzerimonas frequens]
MSGISNDDLNLNADVNDRLGETNYAGQAYVGPVRGVDGMKAIFAPANRKRLIAYGVAAVLLTGAIIWVFFSFDKEEALRGGMGSVKAPKVQTTANQQPSQTQLEEAARYNEVELPREQEKDPTLHPVLVTAPEPATNPFEQKSELARPGKVSDAGRTTTANRGGGTRNAEAAVNYNEMDDLIRQLIAAEGEKMPESYSVEWQYRAAAVTDSGDNASIESGNGSNYVEAGSSQQAKCKTPVARAGQMNMATADIALNSDVGGPVALTIRSGRLRGAQLLGNFERKEEWLRMELNKLVTADDTIGVEAIALDMETTLNAVQGEVDRHVMYRYGWWGFGTVLKAVGKAAELNADSDIYVTDGTVVESTQSSSSRELKLALGSLGEDMGAAFQDRLNRPITVSLKVNDEVGVFFMDDVCLPDTNSF